MNMNRWFWESHMHQHHRDLTWDGLSTSAALWNTSDRYSNCLEQSSILSLELSRASETLRRLCCFKAFSHASLKYKHILVVAYLEQCSSSTHIKIVALPSNSTLTLSSVASVIFHWMIVSIRCTWLWQVPTKSLQPCNPEGLHPFQDLKPK